MSQLFAGGSQSTGVAALASVLQTDVSYIKYLTLNFSECEGHGSQDGHKGEETKQTQLLKVAQYLYNPARN